MKLYQESGSEKIPVGGWLSDEIYAKAIEGFVIYDVDTTLINTARKTLYLAKRCILPMNHWWIIGGRVLRLESEVDAIIRIFKGDTGLFISPERFVPVPHPNDYHRYQWKDREQEPKDLGSDNVVHNFSLELTDQEIALVKLNPGEYESSLGLVEFDRNKLIAENVYSAIVDIYDQLFPSY